MLFDPRELPTNAVALRPLVLSPKQERLVLEMFLHERVEGWWPTHRELANRCSFSSPSVVHYQTRPLLENGVLELDGDATIARRLRPNGKRVCFARVDGAPCLYEAVDRARMAAARAESERSDDAGSAGQARPALGGQEPDR